MRQLLPLLVTGVLIACGDAPSVERTEAHDRGHEHAPAEAAAAAITGESVYNLTGSWWDAAADTAPLARLAGRPQVVALVYTSCAQACPAIVAEMKRVEAALGDDAANVGFVLASIDPERDSPGKLAEFAQRAGLDSRRWTLLAAPDADVLELAAVLGVQYRRLPDGEFAHSNVLTVLDANGEIAHRQLGLGVETATTVEAARRLIHSNGKVEG